MREKKNILDLTFNCASTSGRRRVGGFDVLYLPLYKTPCLLIPGMIYVLIHNVRVGYCANYNWNKCSLWIHLLCVIVHMKGLVGAANLEIYKIQFCNIILSRQLPSWTP